MFGNGVMLASTIWMKSFQHAFNLEVKQTLSKNFEPSRRPDKKKYFSGWSRDLLSSPVIPRKVYTSIGYSNYSGLLRVTLGYSE
jgi:hypothetical protein